MNGVKALPSPQDILDELGTRHPPGYDLSLGRITRLLETLGNPHLSLPPVFHVAGTNGKGSTTAFLRAMIEASGKRVHTHISPHLVRPNERYRLAKGVEDGVGTSAFVDDDLFAKTLIEVDHANGANAITVHEILTATMFLLFARVPADYAVLEVGLGGRADATNIIAPPACALITSISLDHQNLLGDTVAEIAGEKAGIIKHLSPVVLAPQRFDDVYEVIERVATKNRAPLQVGGQDWMVWAEAGRMVYQDNDGLMDLTLPKLLGAHQLENAGTAIAGLKAAKVGITQDYVEAGLKNVTWNARMEHITRGRLIEALPAGSDVWLDGGHNPAASQAISAILADLEERSEKPLVLVCGMLNTKDPLEFFKTFTDLAANVITVPILSSDAGYEPQELAKYALAAGLPATSANTLTEALSLASEADEGTHVRILVCGSLYLAGSFLEQNETLPI